MGDRRSTLIAVPWAGSFRGGSALFGARSGLWPCKGIMINIVEDVAVQRVEPAAMLASTHDAIIGSPRLDVINSCNEARFPGFTTIRYDDRQA